MTRINPQRQRWMLTPLSLALLAALPQLAISAPDACVGSDCQGDQSAGISITAPPATVNVFNLSGPIRPASGTAGVRLRSTGGSDLTINAGRAQSNLNIVTGQAPGIAVSSQGTPPTPADDPLLGIPIPGTSGVSGGVVRVDSYSDIATSGTNAHGISAQSSTSGYADSVITRLEGFSDNGISFNVTAVKTPGAVGADAGVGSAVTALIAVVQTNPDGVQTFVGYAGEAGAFTVGPDGTIVGFDTSTGFDDLAVGESRTVAVKITVDGYRNGVLRRTGEEGELSATVTRTDSGLEVVKQVYFNTFGDSLKPQTDGKALPDLGTYVQGLLDDANGAGGAGNSVTVHHRAGTIDTTGAASHGVFAQSNGKDGSGGRNGGGFFSFGTREPTGGGSGNAGGDVTVQVDGNITTEFRPVFIPVDPDPLVDDLLYKQQRLQQMGQASAGVLAQSSGGNGGRGGNGGTYYSGRRGGTGGDGGLVEVLGNGVISTQGHYSSGIVALSEGGDGGTGGDGGFVTSGSRGGFGGRGGTVDVDGSWSITTQGNSAHGIWAKSVGGNAGTGGSGGWLAGGPGGGGQATDGGAVTLISGGSITTWGSESYGLFAQSVGGFGGSGGSGGSIFYSRGGSGESAGSGGAVSVLNLSGGEVITHGDGSHAVYAQSIGGGGGAGGGGAGIVGVGGTGGAGGFGGVVGVDNAGLIQTYGENARGIYAQSVGGGGGDGGNSAGLVAVGGSGSGTSDGGNVTVGNSGVIETAGTGANAIFAQSIGGGGGSGGSSTGWFSVGGSGGGGGNAGQVAVNNNGATLATTGADATAIYAQSVGGGGGKGGNGVAVGAFVSLAIGGGGAAGGKGADVSVQSLAGDVLTAGDRSFGIFAQSIGGGGGDGGFAVSASVGIGGSLAIGVGGTAGGGGDAGWVNVVNQSHIQTVGDDANGIFAESIGGGGGRGGFAISGAASDGVAVTLNFGGKGGSGGDGKAVDVANSGFIATQGNRSIGLQAQSVGGGGGSGGFSITGSGAGIGALSLGVGGFGGSGGQSDTVRAENDGRLETHGNDAYGLLAQSVGGGGGNGGFSIAAAGAGTGAGSLGIGGGGGAGGNGSTATVINRGAIDTWGDRAVGLFTQSVGGGGGNGGFVITGAGAGTGAGTLSVGGSGDGGGDAGLVTVNNSGAIHTRGADAYGLVAQSVGGGGGSGAFSITGSGAGTGAGSLGIGGFGALGGDGQRVVVTNAGGIDTEGERAVGLFAQSVGGGGGSGGFSLAGSGAGTGAGTFSLGGGGGGGGKADLVSVGNAGRIVTQGDYAYGLLAQSVGGGGGNGGFSITGSGAGTGAGSAGIGGFAGDGGDGKAVTVDNDGSIYTYGEGAAGLFAQSVGGGGGTGGFSIAGSGAKTGSASFSLGGGGGGGGNADVVSVINSGAVTTYRERSYGVIAQSVGGGGGAGGFSFSGGVTTDGFSVNASIGGSGGTGGNGGNVNLVNHGAVTTNAADAHALVAQSLGGGGGSGGFSGSLTAGAGGKPNVSISIGGSGGAAGDAGATVHVENDAELLTAGIAAYGLFAQSVGGGGGDGGGSLAIVLGKHDGGANVAASYGGSGNAAGNGGSIDAVNAGEIITTGAKAHGIVAQSVGGGGGNGGFSVTGVLAKGTHTKDLSVSVGGFGGAGGDAGAVTVANAGAIHALGTNAGGIVAQSLGGGGGNGGFSFAGSFAGAQAKDLAISVGGFGGAAGKGQAVSVINTGVIETGAAASAEGTASLLAALLPGALADPNLPPLPNPPPIPPLPDDPEARLIERHTTYTAYGIFAQSVGGGGGTGGTSVSVGTGFGGTKDTWNVNSAVAVGGFGGSGNSGGLVSVSNENTVLTHESDSHAIFAQSVGGGGGAGGGSFTATIGLGASNEGRSLNANLSVGGGGGSGNLGGEVHVANDGSLVTFGDMSDGIRAQSIGGGGGSGGSARSINLLLKAGSAKLEKDQTAGANWKTQIDVGGSGGDGNDGGLVQVANAGDIVTAGTFSRGIFAQSIGGGGGSGGDGILGTGTAADYVLLAAFPLTDPGGKGINKYVGGQLRDLSLTVGGSAGSQGDGSSVQVDNTGSITTLGYGATAILAQSVGGGGGEALSFASGEDSGGKAVAGALGKFAIGGAAGAAGNGGAVHVNHVGTIDTSGDAAHGIFAQSVGGGGGNAGNIERALSGSLNIGLGLDLCPFGACTGGGAGNGGAVAVTSAGDIVTRGADAYGIWAQSVGGGGGTASGLGALSDPLMPLIGLAGSVGGQGSGGAVDITHTGNIVTYGYASHGIFAQSAGGKQSDDGTSYLGVGGRVTVTLDGNIFAAGADSDGILAQSIGVAGRGNVSVDLHSGTVVGGSGLGAGVRFLDGSNNTLTNRGSITSVGGMAGNAVIGTVGNETVNNFGSIIGNVDLGAGANTLNNRSSATLNSGTTLHLGVGNTFTNEGSLSPGGSGNVLTTQLTGDLAQTGTGVYAVDLDIGGQQADRVNLSGTATLGGRVVLNVRNPAPADRRIAIVSAEGGISAAALAIDAAPSAVASYELVRDGNDLTLGYRIDFSAVAGLNANQARIGAHANDILRAGGTPAFAPIAETLFALPQATDLAAAYDRLSPESYVALGTGSLVANLQFNDAMLSCRMSDGESRFVREGECAWMAAGGSSLRQQQTDANLGFRRNAYGIAGGLQREIGKNWHVGFGLGVEHSTVDVGGIASSQGNQVQAGIMLKGRRGDTTFSAGLSGGYGNYTTQRVVNLPVADVVASADPRIEFMAGHLRLAHAFEHDGWYLRPLIDAGVTHVTRKAFQERGAGAASLDVQGDKQAYWTLQPALEVGGESRRADGVLIRPFVRLGVVHLLSGTAPEVQASLQGAPSAVAPFAVNGKIDKSIGELTAAVDVLRVGGTVIRLGYSGQFSRQMESHSAVLKVSMPF